jgi:Glyoxalase/Bleomycin resistance protein/Dioxygenase superfamily
VEAPFFHVGIIVPDLGQARRDLSSTLGLTWSRERHVEIPVVIQGKRVERNMTVVYSVEGPPYLELVVESGPPWNAQDGLHHMGMWSEDIIADIDALVAQKYTLEATTDNRLDNYNNGFAYLKSPTGILVELVDSRRRAPFTNWITGGEYE